MGNFVHVSIWKCPLSEPSMSMAGTMPQGPVVLISKVSITMVVFHCKIILALQTCSKSRQQRSLGGDGIAVFL